MLTLAFVHEPRSTRARRAALDLRRVARASAVPGLDHDLRRELHLGLQPAVVLRELPAHNATLGLSEQVFGNAFSLFSAGAMAATVGTASYCRRIGTTALLHCAIATGVDRERALLVVASAQSLYSSRRSSASRT